MDTSTRTTCSKSLASLTAIAIMLLLVPATFARTPAKITAKAPFKVATKAALTYCAERCAQQFPVATTRDVTITTTWTGITAGQHTELLVLNLPSGQVYQKFQTNFDSTAVQSGVSRRAAVTNILPVAGTSIQQRNLSGVWTVQVYLDGKLITTDKLTFKSRTSN